MVGNRKLAAFNTPFIKTIFSLFSITLVQMLISTAVLQNILPLTYSEKPVFFPDILGYHIFIPANLLFFIPIPSLILIWLISRKLFNSYNSLIPPLIFAISPWANYLASAGSFYIFLLFCLLIMLYGLVLIVNSSRTIGLVFFAIGFALSIYSSIFMLPIMIVSLLLLLLFNIVPMKFLKFPIIIAAVFALPILFISSTRLPEIKNITKSEIGVFSDPGLLNAINTQRGYAHHDGFGTLAKITSNKYLNYTEYIFLKSLQQLTPSTYFTSQEKLLGFSFSPPIYLGFIIPFLLGLYAIIKNKKLTLIKILLVSLVFTVPSLLSKQAVDLNRLILFYPAIIFIIAYGFIVALNYGRKKRLLLLIIFFFVVFQMLATLTDIQNKENIRMARYLGASYKLTDQ